MMFKAALLLVALCSFSAERLGVDGRVYVVDGTRYPSARLLPQNPSTATSSSPAPVVSANSASRRDQMDVTDSNVNGGSRPSDVSTSSLRSNARPGTVSAISASSVPLTRVSRTSQISPTQINTSTEPTLEDFVVEQQPLDFNLNVQHSVEFVPGLKSVVYLPNPN